ncbi:uncharacterized protein M6B38_299595 [Iris pallida]|uniref:Uncharacterized protein n=1 Tax=Iris pallida TaxID=29817 RepID=A0AAX6HPQ4_IRIPA|nr:uncharacterized protein M6B38_299595 [Iris pallida]
MVKNEVVFTYKRKRLSQSNLVHGVKAPNLSPRSPVGVTSSILSPEAELDTCAEKLKEYPCCCVCNGFEGDENMLSCECCLKTCHLQCTDSAQKYTQEKWRCSSCHRLNDFEESVEVHAQASKRARNSKSNKELEMGSMEVSLNKNLGEASTKKGTTSAAYSSVTKSEVPVQMGNSYSKSGSSKFTDLDDIGISIPVCTKSSSEIKHGSQCLEASFMMTPNSDKTRNRLGNDGHPKENCRPPLITFCRRVKKTHGESDKTAEKTSKAKENQCSSATEGSHLIEESISAAISLQKTKLVNTKKDNRSESAPVGGSGEKKDAGDECKELASRNACEPNVSNPLPSQPAPATDIIKHSSVIQDSELENSANIGTIARGEFLHKASLLESEKTILPYDAPVERDNTCEMDISAAPPASTCLSNVESRKPSIDVVESQSSSEPSCAAIVLAEEKDEKGKELAWLENLHKVLRDKKERETCTSIGRVTYKFIENNDSNRGQASSEKVFPLITTKSYGQNSRDQGEVALTKLADPGCRQQQQEEVSNRPFCTDFLGQSPPLNPGAPADAFKDFHSILSSSSLGVKDNTRTVNRHLPWHVLEDNSSSQRHKQNNESVMNGSRVLKEREISFLDKFRRYPNEWSEEELDFLWIGVRRHGLGNWNGMLRDRRLHFLESRTAEDLAMQWDVEQRKLVHGTLVQPLGLSSVYHSSHTMGEGLLARQTAANQFSSGNLWPYDGSEFPILTAEAKISLGDSHPRTRNFFHSSTAGKIDTIAGESSSTNTFLGNFSLGPVYSRAGTRHQKPIRMHSKTYDWETSTSQQKPSELLTHDDASAGPSSALPHWLKEALNKAPRRRESSLSPVVSAGPHSASLLNNHQRLNIPFSYNCEPPVPLNDSRGRGILKRKSVGSGKRSGGLRVNEASSSLNEPWDAGVLTTPGKTSHKSTLDSAAPEENSIPNLNKKYSGSVGPSELVVIDSDASSEETISDNQNSRPS